MQGKAKLRRSNDPHAKVSSSWQRTLSPLVLGGSTLFLVAATVGYSTVSTAAQAPKTPPLSASAQKFLRQSCVDCHSKENASGGLDLTMAFHPSDPANFDRWVKVVDRVSAGEMPPKDAPQPSPATRDKFVSAVSRPLMALNEAQAKREGRATWRRMNRYEYANTLRDLLEVPWLQVKEMLPEDGLAARFNKSGDALDVSHVQMSRYLAAANYALREALSEPPTRPETKTTRYHVRDERSFAVRGGQASERGTYPILGKEADLVALERAGRRRRGMGGMGQMGQRPPMPPEPVDPARREQEAVGVVASAYEPLTPQFDRFHAPVSGRYKLRLRAWSFWTASEDPKRWWKPSLRLVSAGRTQEPVSLYSSLPQGVTRQLRKLGTFDVGPDPTIGEMEVVLLQDESVMPDAARLFRSRPPNWHNPLATPEGQPGVAFQWLEVEGPLYDKWPTPGQTLLTGGLPLKVEGTKPAEIIPNDPAKDGERLVRGFVQRAYRRPVAETDIQPFVKLFQTAQGSGASFTESLLTAYSGVLCSPGFITLEERPGKLDDYALASRLSYFLWNSEPDGTLRTLAAKGKLHDPKELSRQTDRMLADPRAKGFVEAFLDYWLDLRKTDITNPDETLYPDYYLDDLLTESAVDETRAFFTELIQQNLPARNLVASDFVMINSRLAELYGLPKVKGSQIQRVSLPKDSVRGGLLTQASVLKVTANGTTTSPVIRGAWITERILGQPVPPPPPSVPAVEPDIRGATTIRELLDKHRSDPTCRSCHARIDPPGFALENFDVFGGWRDRYRALGEGEKVPGFGKNGQPFVFHAALPVDPSGAMPDGRRFKDVREMKQLLLQDERQIARNLLRQLVTYSTGAPVRFGDRPAVEAILNRAETGGYGVKTLIHEIIASNLFRDK